MTLREPNCHLSLTATQNGDGVVSFAEYNRLFKRWKASDLLKFEDFLEAFLAEEGSNGGQTGDLPGGAVGAQSEPAQPPQPEQPAYETRTCYLQVPAHSPPGSVIQVGVIHPLQSTPSFRFQSNLLAHAEPRAVTLRTYNIVNGTDECLFMMHIVGLLLTLEPSFVDRPPPTADSDSGGPQSNGHHPARRGGGVSVGVYTTNHVLHTARRTASTVCRPRRESCTVAASLPTFIALRTLAQPANPSQVPSPRRITAKDHLCTRAPWRRARHQDPDSSARRVRHSHHGPSRRYSWPGAVGKICVEVASSDGGSNSARTVRHESGEGGAAVLQVEVRVFVLRSARSLHVTELLQSGQ